MDTHDSAWHGLFQRLHDESLPEGFSGRLFARIDAIEAARERRMTVLRAGIAVASAIAFFLTFRSAIDAAALSGFDRYVSMLFTDSGAMFSVWQDFAFALMESLPAASIAGCVIALAAFAVTVIPQRAIRHHHA